MSTKLMTCTACSWPRRCEPAKSSRPGPRVSRVEPPIWDVCSMLWLIGLFFGVVPFALAETVDAPVESRTRVYVACNTKDNDRGIGLLELDPSSGVLRPLGRGAGSVSPSFLAIHPDGRFLYAVN